MREQEPYKTEMQRGVQPGCSKHNTHTESEANTAGPSR